jgi:hypothetical protein
LPDAAAPKAESKTQSKLLGKVSASVIEIYQGQEKLSETVRVIEERFSGLRNTPAL